MPNVKIEEYIAKRKNEDHINEFDAAAKPENIKNIVNYVFEFFNNYATMTESEERSAYMDAKTDKYLKRIEGYSPEIKEWLVSIYKDYGKQFDLYVKNLAKCDDLFLLYTEDSEFRSCSYEYYAELVKRQPFIQGKNELLFLLIKEYHHVTGEKYMQGEQPKISENIDRWVENTWKRYHVNLYLFAEQYANDFFDNETVWPASHRIKTVNYRLGGPYG